jgi:hypothetical protein
MSTTTNAKLTGDATETIALHNLLNRFRANCHSLCIAQSPVGNGDWLYYEGRKAVLAELIENLYGPKLRAVTEEIEASVRAEIVDRYGIAYH